MPIPASSNGCIGCSLPPCPHRAPEPFILGADFFDLLIASPVIPKPARRNLRSLFTHIVLSFGRILLGAYVFPKIKFICPSERFNQAIQQAEGVY